MRSVKTWLALIALFAVAACGSTEKPTPKAAGPKPLTVKGTLDLSGSGNGVIANDNTIRSGCSGQNGFDDIAGGAQIVIRDKAGKTLALGTLDDGYTTGHIDSGNADCRFGFSVFNIKSKSDIFSVEVAHRGQFQFERADAGSLALSLG